MELTRTELICLAIDAMARAQSVCEETDSPEIAVEHLERALTFLNEAQK